MTVVAIALTVVLAAEYCFAPVNLLTGRTIENYQRFTGMPIWFARRVLAPVKAATAVALVAGLAWRPSSVAGAAASIAISLFYLVRLSRPGGRDGTGFAAFGLFGALSVALLWVQLAR